MRTGILSLMLGGVVALSAGCGLVRARQTVLDIASARCEGEPAEADWSRAAGVTFGKTGAARFLWNDRGIHCRLSEGIRPPIAILREPLCVQFWLSSRMVRVYVYVAGSPLQYQSIEARAMRTEWFDNPPRSPAIQDLPPDQWRFVVTDWGSRELAAPHSNQEETREIPPWTADLFVSWKALSDTGKPAGKLWIDAFLLKAVVPSASLRLNLREDAAAFPLSPGGGVR